MKDRISVITGGSRGIGRAIALELARSGSKVAVCARNEAQLKAVETELKATGAAVVAASCDVRDEASVNKWMERVAGELGPIDILVNNAGIYRSEPVHEHTLESWDDILRTNLTSAMLFSRAALKSMMSRGWGRIINISSISGRAGEIWGSAYSASKFGMVGLTQSLALEVAKHGITVNAVCPGWVATEMAAEQLSDPQYLNLTGGTAEDAVANACFAIPINRMIEAEEVAALVAFLASDAARGITGQSINICGGLSLG